MLAGSESTHILDNPKAITKPEGNDIPKLRLADVDKRSLAKNIPETIDGCFRSAIVPRQAKSKESQAATCTVQFRSSLERPRSTNRCNGPSVRGGARNLTCLLLSVCCFIELCVVALWGLSGLWEKAPKLQPISHCNMSRALTVYEP